MGEGGKGTKPLQGQPPPAYSLTDGYAPTDCGNAQRFIARYGDRLLCVGGQWYLWAESHWAPDRVGTVQELAKAEMSQIDRMLQGAKDAEAKRIRSWIRHSLNAGGIGALLKMASTDPAVACTPDDLDADSWLLNCPNGTVNLRTGELMPHNRQHKITKVTGAPFDPDAECPRFFEFLTEVTLSRQALADYLQLISGYSITGSTKEQCFFINHGEGRNGKGTFMRAIHSCLGDYFVTAGTAAFFDARTDGLQPEVVRLRGARFVETGETSRRMYADLEMLKRFTGGDDVTARTLRQEPITFRPVCKIWFATNAPPRISSMDHGTWRRIRTVPWDARFDGEDEDKDLDAKLADEGAGILAWLIRGAGRYQAEGLHTPTAVLEATADYRRQEDILGQWIEDDLELVPPTEDTWLSSKALYASYRHWCEKNGNKPKAKSEWGKDLARDGITQHRKKDGRGWLGVRIRGTWEH